jgi:hypothetical protein
LLPRLGLPSGSTLGAGTTCAPFPAIVAVDVRGATGVETTANGVETSLPSAIPGHVRMSHLALAPTLLTLDQPVRLLGRSGLPSIQLVRRLRCSSAADYASALSLRQVFQPTADESDHRHRRLLRARRKRPRCRPAERGDQFPPSDSDRHVALPSEGCLVKEQYHTASVRSLRARRAAGCRCAAGLQCRAATLWLCAGLPLSVSAHFHLLREQRAKRRLIGRPPVSLFTHARSDSVV